MSDAVKVGFAPFSAAPRAVLVVFCDEALKFGAATGKALGAAADTVKRAAAANQFKGKSGSTLDIPAPEGIKAERLIVVGVGKASEIKEKDFLKFGGVTEDGGITEIDQSQRCLPNVLVPRTCPKGSVPTCERLSRTSSMTMRRSGTRSSCSSRARA